MTTRPWTEPLLRRRGRFSSGEQLVCTRVDHSGQTSHFGKPSDAGAKPRPIAPEWPLILLVRQSAELLTRTM
jgi:hypothetical protein